MYHMHTCPTYTRQHCCWKQSCLVYVGLYTKLLSWYYSIMMKVVVSSTRSMCETAEGNLFSVIYGEYRPCYVKKHEYVYIHTYVCICNTYMHMHRVVMITNTFDSGMVLFFDAPPSVIHCLCKSLKFSIHGAHTHTHTHTHPHTQCRRCSLR